MRHDDNRAGVAAQETLEPAHALEIEMVGRLVEQQHFGVAHKQLGESQSHLPTTRELAGQAIEVVLLETKAEQHRADLRLDGVTTQNLVVVARSTRRSQLLFGRIGAKLSLEFLQASLGLEDLDLRREDLLEDGVLPHLDSLLFEVADARILCQHDPARIGVFFSRDDAQQRGLAGAVGADERKTIVFLETYCRVGEQRAPAKRFGNMFKLKNHSLRILPTTAIVRVNTIGAHAANLVGSLMSSDASVSKSIQRTSLASAGSGTISPLQRPIMT